MKSLKLTVLFLCLYVLTANASAQDIGRYLVPQEARDALIEMKATVHHGSAGGDFTVDLTPEEIEVLRRHGFEVRPFPAEEETYALGGLGSWTSYGQIRADFIAYAANYPDIAEYHVIGHSVQGREIFGLRISDNIQLEEDEPEVVFWGNIHGDEEASGEITYNYAMELLDNYGAQPTVTGFINDFEIWVLPLTNPDGRVMSTRENANGVDLNRDFGWNWDHWGGSTSPYSQVETQAFQEFCLENNITLSATLHCSGNIFLYPWCYSPTDVPEDNLVQSVGALYANAANYTLIKSWDDYETHGELLDLMYGGHGALCYTPEISNSLNNFPNSYARNKAGMNAFLDVAGYGLHGLVTDAQTGLPLRAAVFLSNSPFPAYTDPAVGDVHRMVEPGTYDVTVWANGYEAKTVTGLQVTHHTTTDFQVDLEPNGDTYAFFVNAVNQEDAGNDYNNNTPATNALGAPDGLACSLGDKGFIVLDMGAGHAITDGPGDDFTITEAMIPGDQVPERFVVRVGGPYDQDILLGSGQGTTSFDLATGGVTSTRYVRITSDSFSAGNDPLAGMELDALTILHSSGGSFVSIGPGTGGAFGTPSLAGFGDLTPNGTGFSIEISSVAPSTAGLIFVGITEANPPFTIQGVSFYLGIPWLAEVPLAVNAAGSLSLSGTVDSALAGLDIALQCLWADTTGPTGKATGTNGLRLEIP